MTTGTERRRSYDNTEYRGLCPDSFGSHNANSVPDSLDSFVTTTLLDKDETVHGDENKDARETEPQKPKRENRGRQDQAKMTKRLLAQRAATDRLQGKGSSSQETEQETPIIVEVETLLSLLQLPTNEATR
jgi:hypothetical protein